MYQPRKKIFFWCTWWLLDSSENTIFTC